MLPHPKYHEDLGNLKQWFWENFLTWHYHRIFMLFLVIYCNTMKSLLWCLKGKCTGVSFMRLHNLIEVEIFCNNTDRSAWKCIFLVYFSTLALITCQFQVDQILTEHSRIWESIYSQRCCFNQQKQPESTDQPADPFSVFPPSRWDCWLHYETDDTTVL